VESLVHVLVLFPLEEPSKNVLARPQPEVSLEDVHFSVQTEALLEPVFVETLPADRRRVLAEEKPSKGVVLSPLKLLFNEVAVLGSFHIKSLFPFLPSWSRSKL